MGTLAAVGVEQLTGNLYRLLLGHFQTYLWRDEAGVTLIDTGPVDSGAEIAVGLDEIGLAPTDVRRVVLTHFHDDHVGAAAEISEWGDVEVVAHVADAPIIRGERRAPPPALNESEQEIYDRVAADLPPAPPVKVDREVTEGDLLEFAGGAQVIAVPGHTAGSIALHLHAHRVLLTGDAVAESLGCVVPGVFNLDTARAVESMRRLAELDVDIACFGHGEPAMSGAGERLRLSLLARGD
jgi:glyoxylase-like metal-dependent hydrolase (beta-lactamase superfamily II)